LHAGVYIVDLNARGRRITNDCRIRGTSRKDVLVGTEEPDLVWGCAGSDRIDTNPGDRWQYGWGGDADIVWAGPGDDVVRTGQSGDVIYGGPGADRIEGNQWKDTLFGGAGNDVLRGGPLHDRLHGGPGRDRLFGGQHADVLLARDGEADEVSCGPGQDSAVGDALDRVAGDCETVSRRY
jgi:Ca2+-binding RTX toxin-like protein